MVKNRFAEWRQGCVCPRDFPVCVCGRTPAAQPVLKKPATATPQELAENPRSRSASCAVWKTARPLLIGTSPDMNQLYSVI